MSFYIVTGTDTGVGKTFVTVSLLQLLRSRGVDAIGLKPIETGWSDPTKSDAAALADASNRNLTETIWGHFALPAAPAVAARAEGRDISLAEVEGWIRGWSGPLTLLEGAGGWLVPLTSESLFRDFAQALQPTGVILVAASKLGTINHTLLSAESILTAGLPLVAVTLSVRPDDDPAALESNIQEIQSRTPAPVLSIPSSLSMLGDLLHAG